MEDRRVRWCAALVLGLSGVLVACGDDGTDGLSSCPKGAIASDKNGVLHCADLNKPRAGSSGSVGASGAKSTPPANAATTPAANGGAGASAPPVAGSK